MYDFATVNFVDLIDETAKEKISRIKENYIRLLRADYILIEKNCLILGNVIGQGNFGCVYKGLLKNVLNELKEEVAVKTLDSSELPIIFSSLVGLTFTNDNF